MNLFGRVVLGLSVGFLVAGVLLSGAAEILLRMYLLSLAGAFVATRAWDAELPRRMTLDTYSPFTTERAIRPPPDAPAAIRQRTLLLHAADDPEAARRTPVPVSVRWAALGEASHRLAERRGLDLNDPEHHPRVRALVSEATWRLIRPPESARAPGGDSGPEILPVTLDRLPSILDDLEKL